MAAYDEVRNSFRLQCRASSPTSSRAQRAVALLIQRSPRRLVSPKARRARRRPGRGDPCARANDRGFAPSTTDFVRWYATLVGARMLTFTPVAERSRGQCANPAVRRRLHDPKARKHRRVPRTKRVKTSAKPTCAPSISGIRWPKPLFAPMYTDSRTRAARPRLRPDTRDLAGLALATYACIKQRIACWTSRRQVLSCCRSAPRPMRLPAVPPLLW